ncbi:MAG: hypothetical protein JJE18_04485 [Eubacteriaceae bacterium]|nr:hypothetical protein [Eubacteriaceae bacterium]
MSVKAIFKAFSKKNNGIKNIEFLPYDPAVDRDYYSFVRNKRKLNYSQVIITSEMMISLIDYYFIERSASITSIELMEEDEEIEVDITRILSKMTNDRAYYSRLIELLRFVQDKSSIDVKKITIKNTEQDKQFQLYIQVNGLVGVDEEFYQNETSEIGCRLESYINL